MQNPRLLCHAGVESCARVWRQDVEGCGLDPFAQRPLHRAAKDACVIVIHAEHKASVHHDAEIVQPVDRAVIVARHILDLVLTVQAGRI